MPYYSILYCSPVYGLYSTFFLTFLTCLNSLSWASLIYCSSFFIRTLYKASLMGFCTLVNLSNSAISLFYFSARDRSSSREARASSRAAATLFILFSSISFFSLWYRALSVIRCCNNNFLCSFHYSSSGPCPIWS